ncbi:hypothetical protein M758_1G115400 [Ceratodon purpureus]|nr:hypothetical protein M758_1G115400 [Ceratodon purpureus]
MQKVHHALCAQMNPKLVSNSAKHNTHQTPGTLPNLLYQTLVTPHCLFVLKIQNQKRRLSIDTSSMRTNVTEMRRRQSTPILTTPSSNTITLQHNMSHDIKSQTITQLNKP